MSYINLVYGRPSSPRVLRSWVRLEHPTGVIVKNNLPKPTVDQLSVFFIYSWEKSPFSSQIFLARIESSGELMVKVYLFIFFNFWGCANLFASRLLVSISMTTRSCAFAEHGNTPYTWNYHSLTRILYRYSQSLKRSPRHSCNLLEAVNLEKLQ